MAPAMQNYTALLDTCHHNNHKLLHAKEMVASVYQNTNARVVMLMPVKLADSVAR